MYRDLTVGLPLDSDQIIEDQARRAEGLGLDVPLLRLADTNLTVYGAMRGLFGRMRCLRVTSMARGRGGLKLV